MTAAATSPEDADAFRRELDDLLANDLPADLAARNIQGFHPTRGDVALWQQILARRGWGAPMWPCEFGGTGWSIRRQHAFEEACFLAGAPPQHFPSLRLVGPVVYTYGDEAQRRRFLPPILNGEEFWAQGFSEPNAGSDLASLRTAALRDGETYVVNGQKLWTSDAQFSDWLILLCRTGFDRKPQQGMSFLAVRLDSPGVTVRPVPAIDGFSTLNEVFLDDVRVPADCLLGEENAGWTYAKFLLGHERANTAEIPRLTRGVARIRSLAQRSRPGMRPLAAEPSFDVRLAELEIDLMALQATVWRVIEEEEAGLGDPTTPSVLKIRGSELLQRINLLQAEALGENALPFYPAPEDRAGTLPGPDHAAGVAADLLYRRAATIFGGSNQIQRNLIARQVLGAEAMASYVPTDDQRLLRGEIRRVLAAERPFRPGRPPADLADDIWPEAVSLGWPAALLPEQAGGIGGLAEAAILAEEFGRAVRPEPADLIGAIAYALVAQGASPVREQLLADILDGQARPALALDSAIQATPHGPSEWRLTGRADSLWGATGATETLVVALAADGLIAARVRHEAPSVLFSPSAAIDGRSAASLDLDGVVVAADAVIADAAPLADDARAAFLVLSSATAVGAMGRAVELTADYVKTRKQFGVEIASFQALQHLLADAHIEVELSRSILARGIEALIEPAAGAARERIACAVKARIGEAALAVAAHTVQLHGGVGVTEAFEVGHHYRRLISFELTAGSRAHHLQRFAELGRR